MVDCLDAATYSALSAQLPALSHVRTVCSIPFGVAPQCPQADPLKIPGNKWGSLLLSHCSDVIGPLLLMRARTSCTFPSPRPKSPKKQEVCALVLRHPSQSDAAKHLLLKRRCSLPSNCATTGFPVHPTMQAAVVKGAGS
jgi:hypothetical protein